MPRLLARQTLRMKKSMLITTFALVGLLGFGLSARADNRRDRRDDSRDARREYDDRYSDHRQLRGELIQLNIMFSRVESQFRLYGIGRQARWEYSRLIRERDRLDYALQRRPLNRNYIHSQIDRIRDELRELEVRMRVRSHRYYHR
jgi:hypothetical protein